MTVHAQSPSPILVSRAVPVTTSSTWTIPNILRVRARRAEHRTTRAGEDVPPRGASGLGTQCAKSGTSQTAIRRRWNLVALLPGYGATTVNSRVPMDTLFSVVHMTLKIWRTKEPAQGGGHLEDAYEALRHWRPPCGPRSLPQCARACEALRHWRPLCGPRLLPQRTQAYEAIRRWRPRRGPRLLP